ncbi:hypothetical protein Ddc_20168 [Ditylenchus destructor]|nr:hypothetical protein Ddc_20168 [Ditylenchus destructor]
MVPMPHLGLVLGLSDWTTLADRLTAAGTDFVIPPSRRFVGEPGEQATMFFLDPCGNPIEVKVSRIWTRSSPRERACVSGAVRRGCRG